jgi:hypothetical protein
MSTATVDRHPATDAPAPARPTPARTVVALALALTAGLALLLTAFAWPATETRPRDVPVAVAGPPAAVEQVRAAVAQAQPGAFDVTAAADAEAARQLVADREVDGALLLGPDGPRVVVAGQGGPAVAQTLTGLAQAAGGVPGVPVEDVAPLPAGDPRGAALAAGALPFAVLGGVAGALFTLRVRGLGPRVAGALLFALLAGPTAVAVLHGWLDALSGDRLAEVAVVTLGLAGTSLGVIGAAAVAGRAGLALAELAVVVLGNPLSAASSAPSFLPDGWSELGQALPPGAIVAALRAVSGFGGTGVAGPVTVLTAWAVGGLVLVAAAVLARRARRSSRPVT